MQNNTIFTLQTNDIDEMAAAFGGLNLVATQLSSGSFISNFLQVQLEDIQCRQISWNQKIQLLGNMLPNTISLWVPLTVNYKSIWNGFECHGQTVILNLDGKVDYTHLAGELVACTIVSREQLSQSIRSCELERLRNASLEHGVLVPNLKQLQILRSYLAEIFSLAVSNPDLLSRSHLNQMIIDNLLSSIAELLIGSKCLSDQTDRSRTRTLKLKQAVEYIRANLHQPLSLQIIATEIGISRRSLMYGFRELFGMGPMEYCKNNRLNAVRRQLKRADSKSDKVLEIAKGWGFHHMGHFAADYKALFGELPSETLRHSPW